MCALVSKKTFDAVSFAYSTLSFFSVVCGQVDFLRITFGSPRNGLFACANRFNYLSLGFFLRIHKQSVSFVVDTLQCVCSFALFASLFLSLSDCEFNPHTLSHNSRSPRNVSFVCLSICVNRLKFLHAYINKNIRLRILPVYSVHTVLFALRRSSAASYSLNLLVPLYTYFT